MSVLQVSGENSYRKKKKIQQNLTVHIHAKSVSSDGNKSKTTQISRLSLQINNKQTSKSVSLVFHKYTHYILIMLSSIHNGLLFFWIKNKTQNWSKKHDESACSSIRERLLTTACLILKKSYFLKQSSDLWILRFTNTKNIAPYKPLTQLKIKLKVS